MKIQFPNPTEYLGREDLFFDQLELCVYHAKKAWAKIINQEKYQKGDKDVYPWLKFNFPNEIENTVMNYKDEHGKYVDADGEGLQELNLSIDEI